MKIILHIAFLTLFTTLLSADPIQVAGTRATFEAPPGFTPLSSEAIALKWPSNRAPKYAIGNNTGSTTVAFDIKPHQVPQDKLTEIQRVFTDMFTRMIPGIEWKKNEIIEHEGQKWIFMEMTTGVRL